MRHRFLFCVLASSLALALLVLAGCTGPERSARVVPSPTAAPTVAAATPVPTPAEQTGQLSASIDQLTRAVLLNIQQHGWNPQAQTHGQVVGGLFINWQMDNPNHTNALKQGSDEATAGSHDPQVDLYYLNALAEYRALHTQDHSFDGETQKALAQVKLDFADYNLPKGWIYFYLLRSGTLLHDATLLNDARTAATNFYNNWYDPGVGLVYNRAHVPGVSNVEHILNCGAALIDAGTRWHQSAWIQAGESTIDHTLAIAIDPQYHLFYNNIAVTADRQLQIVNHQAKPSTQGNSVEALVTAYTLTHRQHYLDVAGQILQAMFSSSLWDQDNGGLFFALQMDTHTLQGDYKETRGQTLSLIGLYHYNLALSQSGQPQQMLDKQQQLIDVLTNHFYQSTYHGFFYRVTPTFQIYRSRPGTGIGLEDFFTTEAMGTAMDALQQTEFAQI